MRKTLSLIFAIMLVLGFTGIASAEKAKAWNDTGAVAGSNYSLDGWGFAIGKADGKVYAPKTGSFTVKGNDAAAAGSYSSQKAKSDAWGLGCGMVNTQAYGEVGQASGALAKANKGNWAEGSQYSGASYYASSRSFGFDRSEGMAETTGGTLVGAANFDIGNTNVGMAGAVTGSAGKAYAGCHTYDTDVWGQGGVAHSSYASKGASEAGTSGYANYSYNKDGRHYVTGGGFAATGGISTVTTHNNGAVTAHAMSGSVSSTCGPVGTSGGVHIDTFNTK
jgi:hypothetical protein